ncbi:MAG: hypothetical protein ACLQSR_00240 [Limisphaerales bacterium]
MNKYAFNLIIAGATAWSIQDHAVAADTTQLQVDYNIGSYTGYNANDYIVDLHGPYNGEVYDSAFSVSYVSGEPIPGNYTDPFTSFCMDVTADLVPNADWKAIAYSEVNTAQLGYSDGSSSLNRAVNLFNAYVNTVNFDSQAGEINGGALQLAIWDVLFGNDLASVNNSSSSFYATTVGAESSAAIAQANVFLDSSANNANQVYLTTYWEPTDANGNPTPTSNQGLIGLDPPYLVPPQGEVPELGTGMAAVAAGLYGIYMMTGFCRPNGRGSARRRQLSIH